LFAALGAAAALIAAALIAAALIVDCTIEIERRAD